MKKSRYFGGYTGDHRVGTVSVFALGPRFVDNNSTVYAITGLSGNGQKNGNGQGFADEDGDGVCDNWTFSGSGQKNGNGQGFADEDGDGVCDKPNRSRQRLWTR